MRVVRDIKKNPLSLSRLELRTNRYCRVRMKFTPCVFCERGVVAIETPHETKKLQLLLCQARFTTGGCSGKGGNTGLPANLLGADASVNGCR